MGFSPPINRGADGRRASDPGDHGAGTIDLATGVHPIDVRMSPHRALCPVPLDRVRMRAGVLAERRAVLFQRGLLAQHAELEASGRIDNFRRASRSERNTPFRGRYYNDSDVYKWLEAACWARGSRVSSVVGAPVVESATDHIDGLCKVIIAAQDVDGYLNTYFTFERAAERFTNLRDKHELYCAGHFIQAAIAHNRATGEGELLAAAVRLADHMVDVFGPAARDGVPGHPNVEMALVELYRTTRDPRYLEQAARFLSRRGRGLIGGDAYHQDHLPFRDQPVFVGHAVRALYLAVAAADLCLEGHDDGLGAAVENLVDTMVASQLYVTGGVGARHDGEAFGEPHELPNARAYAETCAAIASIFLYQRLLLSTGRARYADLIERALYNAVLVGASEDGTEFFYHNPLADDGRHRRQRSFDCACCPPNFARLIAALPSYYYAVSDAALWLLQYGDSEARVTVPGAATVVVEQRTHYPWDGHVELRLELSAPLTLRLRIPEWHRGPLAVTVDGRRAPECRTVDGWLSLPLSPAKDCSAPGVDRARSVVFELAMPPRAVQADPRIAENRGCMALMRGPLVYCVEQADHAGVALGGLRLTDPSGLRVVRQPWDDFLAADVTPGVTPTASRAAAASAAPVVTLVGAATAVPEDSTPRFYRPRPGVADVDENLGGRDGAVEARTKLVAIPYFLWAHRSAGAMRVWLRR